MGSTGITVPEEQVLGDLIADLDIP